MAKINEYPLERFTFGDDDYYDIDYWDGAVYQSAKIKGSTIKAAMSGGGSILAADGQVMPADRSQDLANFKLSLRDGVFTLGTVDADFGSIFQATKDSGNTYATIKTKTNDNAALILDINTADVTGAGNKTAFIQFRDAGVSKYIFGTNTDGVANFSDNSFFISSSAQLTDYIQAIDRDTESFVIGRQVGNPLNDNTKFLINNGNSFDTTELDNVLMLSSRDETKKWSVDKDMVMSHTKAQSLELTSTDRGLLLNRVTTAQMNAIASPTTNEIVYNTDLNGLYRYDGANWVALSAGYGLVSVNDSSGIPTFYATLKSAVDAIAGNGVVNIHSDISVTSAAEEATIGSNDTLTINGNGYFITHTSNIGDEFNIVSGFSKSTSKLYLNNCKVLSNGTAASTSAANSFNSASFANLTVYCDDLVDVTTINNAAASLCSIYNCRINNTNNIAVDRSGIYNCVINGNEIDIRNQEIKNSEIILSSNCSNFYPKCENSYIECNSVSGNMFSNISSSTYFKNCKIKCASGTNRIMSTAAHTVGDNSFIFDNCEIIDESTGAGIDLIGHKVRNLKIFKDSGQAISFNMSNQENPTDGLTVYSNASSGNIVKFKRQIGVGYIKGVNVLNRNTSYTDSAIFIETTSSNPIGGADLYIYDNEIIVNNNSSNHIELELNANSNYYVLNNTLSFLGAGIEYNGNVNAMSNVADSYNNIQIG